MAPLNILLFICIGLFGLCFFCLAGSLIWVIAGESIQKKFDVIIFFISHVIFLLGSKIFGLVSRDFFGVLFVVGYFLYGILIIHCLEFLINLKLLIWNRADFSFARYIILVLNLFFIIFFLWNMFSANPFYELINLMNR